MSVRIMAQIWPLPMHTTEKIILLKLADCASDDGRNAYPTVARIAAETGVCERTVQYTLRRLEDRGYVAVEHSATGGRGRPASYRITVSPATERVQLETEKGATDDRKGATDDDKGCKAFAPDPSVNHQDPSLTVSGTAEPSPAPEKKPRRSSKTVTPLTQDEREKLGNEFAGLDDCDAQIALATSHVAAKKYPDNQYGYVRNWLRREQQFRTDRKQGVTNGRPSRRDNDRHGKDAAPSNALDYLRRNGVA